MQRTRQAVRVGKPSWWKTACAACVVCAAAASALPAQTFTTLVSFDYTDGAEPLVGLVQGNDGNLYGTASIGGANHQGAFFKMTPTGTLTTLYSFCSVLENGFCQDGQYPLALVQSSQNFYGTTENGGANGEGTVFAITPNGTLTTLYSFCSLSGCADGQVPLAGLVEATDGNFYGTTEFGGANGAGTVFKISPTGTVTVLYSFCSQAGCADGSRPYAALTQATDGNLYGTTFYGGTKGDGTVFKITPGGALTTLHSFCSESGCTDGSNPEAALVQGTDGNLYGTTEGGAHTLGSVFEITPTGALATLHSFDGADGQYPEAALVQATDGSFYGTTVAGGAQDYGMLFKITPSGTLTTLYTFCSQSGCTDGTSPYGGLAQDTNGTLYGTTGLGGPSGTCTLGCGTVFSLSVGLGPFVETQPTLGRYGVGVRILGTNLTGATRVSFNGTTAIFTVVSTSLITTTVPVEASSGKVAVATPRGTLTSNVPFRVLP
jgi:uncharacterized repeat protein (TIGR03803 family)